MIGTSWMREQGMRDALLVEEMRKRGLESPTWYAKRTGRAKAASQRWMDLAPLRDGPVKPERADIADPAEMSERIKAKARELGADDVGMTALRPDFIELGVDLPHDNVIAIICYEDYEKALDSPAAVEIEAMEVYAKCAEIATELARFIRAELGFEAVAHHNGSCQIQAIPVFHAVGFGELGRNGSLIHPEFGCNFRPGFVTTTLPLASDAPRTFGVQDYCTVCNLCRQNCPGDAIPDDYIMTDGIKRWLTNIEKCYPYSRFRESYCHICVDVCPYIHKLNEDGDKRRMFKDYMKVRKAEGYRTPKGDK